MSSIGLVELRELKQVFKPDLGKVLSSYRRIMRSGKVDIPIVVERKSHLILKGAEVFEALKLFSASKAPGYIVDGDEVRIRRIGSEHEVFEINDLLKFYYAGHRLPQENFEVEAPRELKQVEYALEDLGVPRRLDRRLLRVYDNALELLYDGWPTPLVKLASCSSGGKTVYAKLESFNPFSNSVKDRVAWSMIMEADALGEILYEATSTNTGIALAAIANILGKRAKLFIPRTIQRSSDAFLRALGAEVIRVPATLTVEAVKNVDDMARRDGATHLNQFENDANFKVHLKYTARELDEQLESVGITPDFIVGGLGTSGHMSAISFYFKSKYGDRVKVVGVQPAPNEVIPGIRRIESGMKWIHMVEFDEIIDVKRDEAIEGVLEVARREGILIGLSSGAVFRAFKKIGASPGNYVLIFPDGGYKYAEQLEEYFERRTRGSYDER